MKIAMNITLSTFSIHNLDDAANGEEMNEMCYVSYACGAYNGIRTTHTKLNNASYLSARVITAAELSPPRTILSLLLLYNYNVSCLLQSNFETNVQTH